MNIYVYSEGTVSVWQDLPGFCTNLRFNRNWIFGDINLGYSATHYYALHSICHVGRLLLCERDVVEKRVNVDVGNLSFWNSDDVAAGLKAR